MKNEIINKGLFFLEVDEDTIMFTTDNPSFKGIELEEMLEKLFKKFDIDEFNIKFHYHEGEKHDKDILFKVKDEEKIGEIRDFILNEFYDLK
jgi:hypothetical protein